MDRQGRMEKENKFKAQKNMKTCYSIYKLKLLLLALLLLLFPVTYMIIPEFILHFMYVFDKIPGISEHHVNIARFMASGIKANKTTSAASGVF